jgi:hypothetical protein
MLEPPFADEGLAARLDLFARRGVDQIVIVGGDLLVQALRRVGQEVAQIVNGATLAATPSQTAAMALSSPASALRRPCS